MSKPVLILDQHFRTRDELFKPEVFAELNDLCEIIGGQDRPLDRKVMQNAFSQADFYAAAFPKMTSDEVANSQNLKAVIELAGAFNEGLAYDACFERNIEVLSCAPGFRQSVGEMTLAMILAGARGLVAEHERFRNGGEHWLDDCEDTDFTLFGQKVGFVGYGQIARETHRLMAPFGPNVKAYDPFLDAVEGVELCSMQELVDHARVIVVAAVPSEENRNLLSANLISRLAPGALVVVISRAWCVDFEALIAAAHSGRIRVATDVFPKEPVEVNDSLRSTQNVIFSPHRAAAVPGGRQLIGDMILHDLKAILRGQPERLLKAAEPEQVASLVTAQKGMAAQ